MKNKIWIVTIATYATSALAIILTTPLMIEGAKNHAVYAASRGEQFTKSDPRQAISNYEVARTLDGSNAEYTQKLADLYLAQGMVTQALSTLKQSGNEQIKIASLLLRLDRPDEATVILRSLSKPSGEASNLLAKALIETESYSDAKDAAKGASEDPEVKEQGIVLGVIAAKLEGSEAISSAAVGSPEALRRILAAKSGETPLAQVLYDLGLLRSSERVLKALPSQSASSYRLQAQIKLAQQPPSTQNLESAVDLLQKGIKIAPYDVSLRKQLVAVYSSLGNRSAVDKEAGFINRLESGKL